MTARHRRTRWSQVTVLDLQRQVLHETLVELYERTAREAVEKFGEEVAAVVISAEEGRAAPPPPWRMVKVGNTTYYVTDWTVAAA